MKFLFTYFASDANYEARYRSGCWISMNACRVVSVLTRNDELCRSDRRESEARVHTALASRDAQLQKVKIFCLQKCQVPNTFCAILLKLRCWHGSEKSFDKAKSRGPSNRNFVAFWGVHCASALNHAPRISTAFSSFVLCFRRQISNSDTASCFAVLYCVRMSTTVTRIPGYPHMVLNTCIRARYFVSHIFLPYKNSALYSEQISSYSEGTTFNFSPFRATLLIRFDIWRCLVFVNANNFRHRIQQLSLTSKKSDSREIP